MDSVPTGSRRRNGSGRAPGYDDIPQLKVEMMNLFSRFRSLFRRSEDDYDDYSDVAVAEMDEPQASSPRVSNSFQPGRAVRVPKGAPAPTTHGAHSLQIPLAPILDELPEELKSRVIMPEVGDISVLVPLQTILPQLAKGVVTIPFGELRRSAPEVFTNRRDQDAIQVPVPLAIILPQLSPDMLARKRGRPVEEIPEDIVSPFADKGKGLSVAASTTQNAVPKAATPKPLMPRPTPKPSPRVAPAAPSAPAATPRTGLPGMTPRLPQPKPSPASSTSHLRRPNGVPRVPATPLATPKPPPTPITPVAPVKPVASPESESAASSGPIRMSSLPGAPIKLQASSPLSPSAQAEPQTIAPVTSQPESEQPVAPAPASSSGKVMKVSVSAVADAWPDALKHEIAQLGLAEGEIALPFEQVEAGLKRGRLAFAWKAIRGWITQGQLTGVSIHDTTELELPLRVVAPLFIKYQKEELQKKPKVAVDKDIPNLFFGAAKPDTAKQSVDHAVTRPLDTNYYVWDDANDTLSEADAESDGANAKTAGTEFVTRCATPNEVVSRAASLDGVAGALIALPDGLMVANKLPEGHNGDTLAAFLPHLFGKVTQCTQELRMGELNNLNFTVGNIPWKIFRVNALYFAAFGRIGEPLPTAQLAALAGELNHKPKS